MTTSQAVISQAKQIEELKAEIENLRHEMKNHQQVAHLKGYLLNREKARCEKIIKECKMIESAFESYVDTVEQMTAKRQDVADQIVQEFEIKQELVA